MTGKETAQAGGYPPLRPAFAAKDTQSDLEAAQLQAAEALDAARAARAKLAAERAERARLERALQDNGRPDLQDEAERRRAAAAGSSLTDLVRSSRSYRLGLAIAGAMRMFSAFKRFVRRGRQNPLFDCAYYLEANPDVRWSGRDAYSHYLAFGASEGRKPNRIFDSRWYNETYPDVVAARANPLVHYWTTGAGEGRKPAPDFDGTAYLATHPDVAAQGVNPLLHFLRSGAAQAGGQQKRERRILVVTMHAPSRAHAGGLRMLDLYSYLRSIAPDIRLDLFAPSRPDVDWSYEDLPKVFTNVYFSPDVDLSLANLQRISGEKTRYDLIDFQFTQAGADSAHYRRIAERLIFTPMELLSRGFALQGEAERAALSSRQRAEQAATERQELALSAAVDQVVCVSNPDADYLKAAAPLANVTALETGVSELEFGALAERAPVREGDAAVAVFVAYFGSETNRRALEWLLTEVHPRVRAAVPNYRLDIVGRGDLTAFRRMADPSVRFVGEVPSVGPAIRDAQIGLAAALGGAGFRGKINQYALLGLPTIASPIAAEGMAYRDGVDIIVGDTPERFAQGCIDLLRDPVKRAEMARRAHQTCMANYSWAAKDSQIRSIYGIESTAREPATPEPVQSAPQPLLNTASPSAPPAEPLTAVTGRATVTALVPSYNHAPYIEQRIRSILNQSYRNLTLVVIDDCSNDGSHEIITRLQAEHGFRYIRREKNSGTPFSAWEFAARELDTDYLWICESDDVAEPHFLAAAVERLDAVAGAVLYYCNSHVIDADGRIVDTTASYFREVWTPRWTAPFIADGKAELVAYQYRGMTVPNMSSALMRREAFAAAYSPDLKRFKLTGDWLFVGRLMTHGAVVFDPAIRNRFRRHEQTARARTQSGQSQAEFILTKCRLHWLAGKSTRELAPTLRLDAARFIHERAPAWSVFRAAWRISPGDTLRLGVALPYSLLFHLGYLRKFLRRRQDLRQAARTGA